MHLEKRFVPIEDVARYFSVSISTVRAWVRQGKIPTDTYIKVGNTYRFSIPKVEDALLSADAPEDADDNEEVDDPQLELNFDDGEPIIDDVDIEEGAPEDVWELDPSDDLDFLDEDY